MNVIRALISANIHNDTPVTLTVTFPIHMWRTARDQIVKGELNRYEAAKLMMAIKLAIDGIEKQLYVPIESDLDK